MRRAPAWHPPPNASPLLAAIVLAVECADSVHDLAVWWQSHQRVLRRLCPAELAVAIAGKDHRKHHLAGRMPGLRESHHPSEPDMDVFDLLSTLPGWASWAPWLTGLVAVSAALSTVLPPPKLPAAGWYPLFYGVVNHLAFNVGHATNVKSPHAKG